MAQTVTEQPEVSRSEWLGHLEEIGRKDGFFESIGDEHSALFVKRGKTLMVTFENLDHVYERSDDRMPWGYGFVEAHNWSMLGLMAHDWTWYRDEAVFDFFDSLRDEGFFKGFERVVFYGASMGAYAACAFSAAAPGATVICISPQATLDRTIASWECRYLKAWRRNFGSRYGYAPDMVEAAEKVHLFYDPHAPLDAMHACLFQSENVTKYKCRFMGHRIASLWVSLGILKPIVEGCVEDRFAVDEFYKLLRARRENPRFQRELLNRLIGAGNDRRVINYCQQVLARRGAPIFRREMQAARKRLNQRRRKG